MMICPKCNATGWKQGLFWQHQYCDCPAGDALRTRDQQVVAPIQCTTCKDRGYLSGARGSGFCGCPAGDTARARATANATQGVTPTTALPPAPGRDSAVVLTCRTCEAYAKLEVEHVANVGQHPILIQVDAWHKQHPASTCSVVVRAVLLPGASEATRRALARAGLVDEVRQGEPDAEQVKALIERWQVGIKAVE